MHIAHSLHPGDIGMESSEMADDPEHHQSNRGGREPVQNPNKRLVLQKYPNQQLVHIPSDQLRLRDRVFYKYQVSLNGEAGWLHGIWDGDAVIHVKHPRCNCEDCVKAVAYNEIITRERRFERGAHVYVFVPGGCYGGTIIHQGIYDGNGYVYHFDKSDDGVDLHYEKCEECRVRGEERRDSLRRRGLGPSGVRKSCLYCFSQGKLEIYHVIYGASLIDRFFAGISAPGTVSYSDSREPDIVVRDAKAFYDDNSFGKYSKWSLGISHNCEAFAYYCKTGHYGAKQVTRVISGAMIVTVIVLEPVEAATVFVGTKLILKGIGHWKMKRAKKKAMKANDRYSFRSRSVPADCHQLHAALRYK